MCSDQVDLITRTEENFGISFDDSELVKVRTIGEYYQLILSKLTPVTPTVCLSSHTFYRIRRALMNKFGISRSLLKPKSQLDTIIPKESRILHWKSLQENLNLKLPDLIRPGRMELLFLISFLLTLVSAIVLGVSGMINALIAWMIALLAIPTWIIEYKLTEKYKIEFPELSNDLGSLTRMVLQRNFSTIQKDVRSWTEKEVYDSLILQLVDQLGIAADKINLNSCIVEDLGID